MPDFLEQVPSWCLRREKDIDVAPNVTVQARGSVAEYLEQVSNRIKMEFKMIPRNDYDAYPKFVVYRHAEESHLLTHVYPLPKDVITATQLVEKIEAKDDDPLARRRHRRRRNNTDEDDEEDEDSHELHYHLVVFEGCICVAAAQGCALLLRMGAGVRFSPPPLSPHEHDVLGVFDLYCGRHEKACVLYDLGYIGDTIAQTVACSQLVETASPHPLLEVVADPYMRTAVEYDTRPMSDDTLPANTEQRAALAALRCNLEAIQGPPGTGKSTTIYHLVKSVLDQDTATLVTCVQNKAVDAVAEKLEKGKLPFVVFGNKKRLGAAARRWTLEKQLKRHPLRTAIRDVYRRLTDLYTKIVQPKLNGTRMWERNLRHQRYRKRRADQLFGAHPTNERVQAEKEAWLASDPWVRCWRACLRFLHPKLALAEACIKARCRSLRFEAVEARATARADITQSARAILCTAASAAGALQRVTRHTPLQSVTSVVLDEAGACPEACLPLLLHSFPEVDRIIAMGDQRQLAAFTRIPQRGVCNSFAWDGTCRFGARCKFKHEPNQGFFHRLASCIDRKDMHLLATQYRMHPKICDAISGLFYDNRLKTAKRIARERKRADSMGMWWVETTTRTAPEEGLGKSYVNEGEACIVAELLDCLRDAKGPQFQDISIKVIAFYKAQRGLLSRKLRGAGFRVHTSNDESRRSSRHSSSSSNRRGGPFECYGSEDENEEEEDDDPRKTYLQVQTVDESQGSEADIVILSCVRSNRDHHIGFLRSPNRINVACSRGRSRLVVVGNPRTLTDKPGGWRCLHRLCKTVGTPGELPVPALPATAQDTVDGDDEDDEHDNNEDALSSLTGSTPGGMAWPGLDQLLDELPMLRVSMPRPSRRTLST